ncbi:MAG: hypothetical protein GW763_05550 [Paraglaciecola sp.]|nr:hypothetical protein [Paraglaciecola sp.]NCT47448.1 hypothetical protein [Paraglaciecola sp.]
MFSHLKQVDKASLDDFAITLSWVFPVLFMGLIPWLFARSPELSLGYCWPLLISLSLLSVRVVYAPALIYPYRLWMAIASIVGWINTRIILAAAFYLLIFPIGVVLRVFGNLQYQGRLYGNKRHASFWQDSQDNNNKEDLEKPF